MPLRTVWIPYWNGLWRMQNESTESGIILLVPVMHELSCDNIKMFCVNQKLSSLQSKQELAIILTITVRNINHDEME